MLDMSSVPASRILAADPSPKFVNVRNSDPRGQCPSDRSTVMNRVLDPTAALIVPLSRQIRGDARCNHTTFT